MDIKNPSRRTSILLGERHTTLFNRFAAKLIDTVIIVAIYFLGSAVWAPLGVFCAVGFCAMQDALGVGQSIGKRIIGLRVIEDQTGLPCSYRASFLRNLPLTITVAFAAVHILWVLLILLALPVLLLEVYLLILVESGVRLGDVLGNTLVVEHAPENLGFQSILPLLLML